MKNLSWGYKKIQLTNFIKHLESKNGFGNKECKDFNKDCANCEGQELIRLLKWYRTLL